MKKSELRKLIKEEISKVLTENSMDSSVEHHIEQIEDDLMYGEFDSYKDVVGYLDDIIKGIEGLKIQQKQVFQDMEKMDDGDEENDPFNFPGIIREE